MIYSRNFQNYTIFLSCLLREKWQTRFRISHSQFLNLLKINFKQKDPNSLPKYRI